MSAITNEWKVLKPAIGNLLCKIDALYNQADDIDHVKELQFEKGRKKGFEEGLLFAKNNDICKNCKAKRFYEEYAKHSIDVAVMFDKLTPKQQSVVMDIMDVFLGDDVEDYEDDEDWDVVPDEED